jgi:hypothetical protein
MVLELEVEELDVLAEVVEQSLGDLHAEIRETDAYDFRYELKAKQSLLKGILERLKQEQVSPA